MASPLKRALATTDFGYLLLCGALSALSVVTLFSVAEYGGLSLGGALGNYKPAYTQLAAVAIGMLGMLLLSMLDYRSLAGSRALHIICWGLVLLTFVPGIGYEPPGTGSKSWIAMPLGMSFQPTEIAKLSFILTFAGHLAKARDTLNHPKTIVPVLCHLVAPVLLVHLQGDDGTAMVFLAIGLVMLLAAGLNRWVVAVGAVAVAVALPFVWQYVLGEYQRVRIIGLFRPEEYADGIMYQQLQGKAAIAAGGLWGKGLFGGQHVYVPRAENDFIFSYFAESCGFVGALVLLGLLFALTFKTLRTAYTALDAAGSLVCAGVFGMLLFQTVVNAGMNLMLLPVMGITLPFVSAGGTSVLTLYCALGLVLNVYRVQKTAPFAEKRVKWTGAR